MSLLFRTFLAVISALPVACTNPPPSDASEQTKSAKTGIRLPGADTSRPSYDRGERVIWRDDFTGYKVGSFPRHMELESGHFDVAEIGGRNYFRSVDHRNGM